MRKVKRKPDQLPASEIELQGYNGNNITCGGLLYNFFVVNEFSSNMAVYSAALKKEPNSHVRQQHERVSVSV